MFAWVAFHLTPGNVPVVQGLHACKIQTREQEGERGMSWMTLIVIELLGGGVNERV